MKNFIRLFCLLLSLNLIGQGTVEAEFETEYNYQFNSIKGTHNKKILIDSIHNTIYAAPYGKETVREMLRIFREDGFEVNFSKEKLISGVLNVQSTDLLIIHGMPNEKTVLENKGKKEILYTSPLTQEEVLNIGSFVFDGGSLLLFLSHFPGGSGALPLLEAFSVKFRDGYIFHPQHHISNGGLCGHFLMNAENQMLNLNHPIFRSCLDGLTIPKNVKFYCGAGVFRNPEDVILPFPKNSINYTPRTYSGLDLAEQSDNYAGMIGFEYGSGRIIICSDQGIFRSLDLLIDGEKIPVTIHDEESDNAGLLLNSIRWLCKLQN